MRPLLHEIFTHSKEISPLPGYPKYQEFGKLTTKAFEQKLFSRNGFQALKDGKHSGFVDTAAMRNCDISIEQILVGSFQARATHFKTISTIAQKTPEIKQIKVRTT